MRLFIFFVISLSAMAMADTASQENESSVSTSSMTNSIAAPSSVSPDWKASFLANYFDMSGTHPASNDVYSFGHVVVSMENFGGEYNLGSNWKMVGNLPYIQNSYELIAKGHTYLEQSAGLGDTVLEATHPILNGPVKISGDFGVSLPTGTTDESNPYVTTSNAHYKYFLQLGSGTYDGVFGLTTLYQGPSFILGNRLSATLRTGLNNDGYRMGNQYRADIWSEVPLAYGLSAKAMAYDRLRGAIAGQDYTLPYSPSTKFYYSDQVDWMASAGLTYRHQVLSQLSISAEFGLPLVSGMINVDNVVITPNYYAGLSLIGQL